MKRKNPALIYILMVLLLADVLCSALMLYNYDQNKCFAILIVTALLVVCFVTVFLVYSGNSLKHISKMNSHLESSAAEYMNSLPAPVAVVDENGTVVWYNRIFSESIAFGNDIFGMDIGSCVTVDINAVRNDGFSLCSVNGCFYRISAEKFDKGDISFLVLYFHDETDYFNLKRITDETHPVVLIINIDNYDEIMQNAKESEKAKTSVETEQLIENFMADSNGTVKKISANTFYAILENKHVNEIITDKFKILDSARAIKVGEKNSLTLSIGVGQGASSISESEKYARQCLDMALGRGGDQAVVKTDNGFRFFGGVSNGVEKKSRAKTRIIAHTLQELISNCNTVYIMGHSFGDLDSVGSSVGLAGAVKLLGKQVKIAVDIKKNLAVHLIENVKKASGENFFVSPSEAADDITENDILIIVDTHNKDFIESKELYRNAKNVVVIDHHRKTVNFIDNAVIFHHEPYASSASEMVTELIQYFRFDSDSVLDSLYADALLSGITLDTKNFVMRTGVRTFEAAAFLKKLGADTVTVKLLFSNSIDSYRRKTQIVASAKIHNSCAIAVADFKADDIRLVAPQAADELLGISGVSASFVIYRTGNVTNISARSMGAMNVQVIMEVLGGGGHQTMAACQLDDASVQEAFKRLTDAIDECTAK
ncbi:MAG: RNA/single-stranded DNA exonuclease [Ruminococcus sp.]|nr:RNA/single-stranded DNA exonuclease [Ruminococcus sp.]